MKGKKMILKKKKKKKLVDSSLWPKSIGEVFLESGSKRALPQGRGRGSGKPGTKASAVLPSAAHIQKL